MLQLALNEDSGKVRYLHSNVRVCQVNYLEHACGLTNHIFGIACPPERGRIGPGLLEVRPRHSHSTSSISETASFIRMYSVSGGDRSYPRVANGSGQDIFRVPSVIIIIGALVHPSDGAFDGD